MNTAIFAPRALAGVGLAALLGAVGLASMRPARSVGGPVAVTVTNAPLAVINRDADNPARLAVGRTITLTSPTAGTILGGVLYTVPANKRLVVEHLSASSSNFNDANGYDIEVDSIQGGSLVRTFFNEVPDAAPFSAASQSVRLYADPGSNFRVAVYPSNKIPPRIIVSFSGYLEDL